MEKSHSQKEGQSLQTNKKTTAILVLGMHRSGTSLVTGLLNMCGIYIGDKLLTPADDNPKGFFESNDILNANVGFLRDIGLDFNGFEPLPVGWQAGYKYTSFKKNVERIIKDKYISHEVFCIKDPRISVLLEVYIDVLVSLGIQVKFVIAKRNPLEVAKSLVVRNKISFGKALGAYSRYLDNIDRFKSKFDHVEVQMTETLKDPLGVISKISKELGLDIQVTENAKKSINSFVEKELKHHNFESEIGLLKVAKEIADTVDTLASKMADKDRDIDFLKKDKLNLENTLRENTAKLQGENNRLIHENSFIKNEYNKISSLVADRAKKVAILENELKFKNEHIKSLLENAVSSDALKEEISKLNKHILYQQRQMDDDKQTINSLNLKVNDIERSIIWKALKSFDVALFMVFPKDSMVGKTYIKLLGNAQEVVNTVLPNVAVRILKKKDKSVSEDFWKKYKKDFENVDILFINHQESRTGAPRIIHDIAVEAGKTKKICMVSLEKGTMTDDFKKTFSNIIYPEDLYGDMDQYEIAKMIVEKVRPKLVFANSIGTFRYCIAAKKLGIPTILHVHELDLAFKVVFTKKERLDFKNFADLYIAVSTPVYDLLTQKMGCSAKKIVKLSEFIDSKKVTTMANEFDTHYIRNELGIKEDEVLVVGLGEFIYRKGNDIFMKVAKRINSVYPNIKFIWIGRRSPHRHYAPDFMLDIEEYSKYFTLLGEKSNPFPYLRVADVMALPSREDPFPLAVLEAMSLGVPPVVFKKAGGIYEAVKNGGIIVEQISEVDFEQAILKLAKNKSMRNKYSQNAISNQSDYDSSKVLPRFMDVINKFI